MMWLPYSDKKFEDMFIRFDRIPACQTDGRKDRRTDRPTSFHSTVRARHTHLAVKKSSNFDEFWYITPDLVLDDIHVTKYENFWN